MPSPIAKITAELFGTFWLVFGGCGTAIFAAKEVAVGDDTGTRIQVGVGYLGVALAFGLTVVTMAYALGHISGGISIPPSRSVPASADVPRGATYRATGSRRSSAVCSRDSRCGASPRANRGGRVKEIWLPMATPSTAPATTHLPRSSWRKSC